MYLLEPMSTEPISSPYESACQKLPASSAYLQYTPKLNFQESQIADDSGKRCSDQDESRTQKARINPVPSGAVQIVFVISMLNNALVHKIYVSTQHHSIL